MPKPPIVAALVVIGALPAVAAAQSHSGHQSPYQDLVGRTVKALSDDETAALLAGEGMGFALAAELNGVPGPKHVLELRSELQLDPSQVARIEGIGDAMSQEAVKLGRALVDAEASLDRAFAHGDAPARHVRELIRAAGELRTQLRATHLMAHLETAEVLTGKQIERYGVLRGYAAAGPDRESSPDADRVERSPR
jgi:Spy/CpxP family protein refolding chaperone